MSKLFRICLVAACVAGLASCAEEGGFKLPGVYRIDIQQGNIITQDMVDKLKPGMDKNQVRFIMGTPVVEDPFHPNRWDYIYTLTKGGHQRHQRHIALFFKDNKLAMVKGDVVPGVHKQSNDTAARSTTVEVPDKSKNENFLERFFEWNQMPEEPAKKKSGPGEGREGAGDRD